MGYENLVKIYLRMYFDLSINEKFIKNNNIQSRLRKERFCK